MYNMESNRVPLRVLIIGAGKSDIDLPYMVQYLTRTKGSAGLLTAIALKRVSIRKGYLTRDI